MTTEVHLERLVSCDERPTVGGAGLLSWATAQRRLHVTGATLHSEVQREEKRFTVTGTPDLRLTTFDGSIQIQSWDKPDILVEIEKRGPTQGVARKPRGHRRTRRVNRIDLEVKRPRSESFEWGSTGLAERQPDRLGAP